jgi:hypothetical protein
MSSGLTPAGSDTAIFYPLGPASPILRRRSCSDIAPGLGCPGGTTGPPCGVGIGGGTPAIAGGMTSGGCMGGGPAGVTGACPCPGEGVPGGGPSGPPIV